MKKNNNCYSTNISTGFKVKYPFDNLYFDTKEVSQTYGNYHDDVSKDIRKCKCNNTIDIAKAAKLLELPYGRNTLFCRLRELGVLHNHNNLPKKFFLNKGYFKIKQREINRKNYDNLLVSQTVVTHKGLIYLSKLLK